MILTINGKKEKIEGISTVSELLDKLSYEGEYFAIAINKMFLPRKNYRTTQLNSNDSIEILCPMQGG